ncbi:MAG: hypothetical protein OWV35_01430 [Firmicutes bacterium]|nr:hypothetical protein [Bacillota bacterium]
MQAGGIIEFVAMLGTLIYVVGFGLWWYRSMHTSSRGRRIRPGWRVIKGGRPRGLPPGGPGQTRPHRVARLNGK